MGIPSKCYVPVAQLDRAARYERAGWGFKSLQAYQVSLCPYSETDIMYRFERYGAGSIPAGDTKYTPVA